MTKPIDKEAKEATKIAETHWKWLESTLRKIYVDAFVHGIKHGKQMNNVQ